MGFSSQPQLIIGVTADEIVKLVSNTEKFDKYDERGNKTGETGSETTITLSAVVNDIIKKIDGKTIFSDSIAELLEIVDSPYVINEFGVFNTSYYDSIQLNEVIIGIMIGKIDVMQNELINIDSEIFTKTSDEFKKLVLNKFSLDLTPKIFLYSNAG